MTDPWKTFTIPWFPLKGGRPRKTILALFETLKGAGPNGRMQPFLRPMPRKPGSIPMTTR